MRSRKTFPIAWTVLILLLCTIPGEDLPHLPFSFFDKLAHLGMFFVFGLAWIWATDVDRWKTVALAGILYGIGLEFYQSLLPFDRIADAGDMAANVAGLALGLVVAAVDAKRAKSAP